MGIGQNFYELLGISPTASAQEIREAYRQTSFSISSGQESAEPDQPNEKMEKITRLMLPFQTLSNEKNTMFQWDTGSCAKVQGRLVKVTVSSHSSAPFKTTLV